MNFWEGRRVLVAGGTGFIGGALVRALVSHGAVVTAVQRGTRPRPHVATDPSVRMVTSDLTDLASTVDACKGQNLVFVAAAADGNAEYKARRAAHIFHTNTLITLNMLEAARQTEVERVVLISSAEVYGGDAAHVLDEDTPIGDVMRGGFTTYALAKVFGEIAANNFRKEYGLGIGLARPANVYGPGDDLSPTRGRVINQWITAGLRGDPITIWGTGDEVRSFIYVGDLVEGLLRMGETPGVHEAVNFAHPDPISLRELAETIVRVGGFSSAVELLPGRAAGPTRRVLCTARAEAALGFRATTSVEAALKHTIERVRSTAVELERSDR